MEKISDVEIALLSYAIGLHIHAESLDDLTRDTLLAAAIQENKLAVLAGELIRRNPEILR